MPTGIKRRTPFRDMITLRDRADRLIASAMRPTSGVTSWRQRSRCGRRSEVARPYEQRGEEIDLLRKRT